MAKRVVTIALVALIVLGGAIAYAFLKSPAEASAPIQAIPLAGEPTTAATATATTPAVAAPAAATASAAGGEPTTTTATAPTAAASGAAGRTTFTIVQEESAARFVIDEVLNGAPKTVVGETDQVAGQLAVDPAAPAGAQVGTIQVNARTLATDSEQRDRALKNQVLQTNQHEYITFAPTAVAGLPDQLGSGETATFQIVGELTIRGVTRPVTFEASVTPLSDSRLAGQASTTIRYADWGVSVPPVPFVASVDDEIRIELDFVATAQ
jgi:polyisoprenoid-binding protein YceI